MNIYTDKQGISHEITMEPDEEVVAWFDERRKEANLSPEERRRIFFEGEWDLPEESHND